MAFKDNEIL